MPTKRHDEPWEDTAWAGPETVPKAAPDTHPGVLPDPSAWSETLPGQAQGRGLCVAVDDVGLHPGVNGAAIDLVLGGRVQAVACRVGAPHWAEAVEHLTRLGGLAVDVGLQIDLCQHPLDPTVARPLRHWMLGLKRPPQDAVRREIGAQFDAFEAALGQPPRFVTGFRHVHQLEGVRGLVMAEIERRFAAGHRPWVFQGQRGGRDPLPQPLRVWLAERGAKDTAEAARAIGAHHNRGLLGVYDFQGGAPRFRQLLERWLRSAREGELLVCHPALPSATHARTWRQRQAEYRVLASSDWPALIERLDIDLQPMSRLLARRSRW